MNAFFSHWFSVIFSRHLNLYEIYFFVFLHKLAQYSTCFDVGDVGTNDE